MSGPLTRSAYATLVAQDIEWLRRQPRTLEREHLIAIAEQSVRDYDRIVAPGGEISGGRSETMKPDSWVADGLARLGQTAKPQQSLALCDETGGATFSPDRVHRYLLWRRWSIGPKAVWIMLNPSTADEVTLDPTVRRCVGFSRMWGCGMIEIVNLFALRSTDPGNLRRHPDPVGPDNDEAILRAAREAPTVVAAWGIHGALNERAQTVWRMLHEAGIQVRCLGLTKDGQPLHPLRLSRSCQLVSYQWPVGKVDRSKTKTRGE